MERKQKVKEIFGSAAMQQGELRKLKGKNDGIFVIICRYCWKIYCYFLNFGF